MRLPRIEVRSANTAPILVGDGMVMLRSWSFAVYGARWVAIWNWPVTVVVERGDNVRSYPVVDITILFQVSWGIVIIAWLVANKKFRAAYRA